MQVEALQQVGLDARRQAVAEKRAVGHHHRGASAGAALQAAHDELQEQQRGFGGAPVLREVVEDAGLLLAAERWVGQDDVHPLFLADLRQPEPERVARVDARGVQPVEQQVHLGQQEGQRLGLAAVDAPVLQDGALLHRIGLGLQVPERLGEETAGAAGRVEDGLAKPRVRDLHHEADHRARGVELAGIAGRVAHFPEQALVQASQGVDFVGRVEVDAVHQVDHVPQQIAALHAVAQPLEHGGDDVAPLAPAVVPAQTLEIGEQSGAGAAIGPRRPLRGQEGQQVRPADAVGRSRPVPPTVGLLDDRTVFLPRQLRPSLLDPFHVVQELEEQDPGEHGQPVQVAVQPLVLAHDLARRLDDAVEPLNGGQRSGRGLPADVLAHGTPFLAGSAHCENPRVREPAVDAFRPESPSMGKEDRVMRRRAGVGGR